MDDRPDLCDNCRRALLCYVDEVNSLERSHGLLGHLCCGATGPAIELDEVLPELGYAIQDHLKRSKVLRAFFFGCDYDEIDNALRASEFERLRFISRNRDRKCDDDHAESTPTATGSASRSRRTSQKRGTLQTL